MEFYQVKQLLLLQKIKKCQLRNGSCCWTSQRSIKIRRGSSFRTKTELFQPKTIAADVKDTETEPSGIITREVLPKETKYGIAKQYGLTVKELENQNQPLKTDFV
jgi:hypothetical protein